MWCVQRQLNIPLDICIVFDRIWSTDCQIKEDGGSLENYDIRSVMCVV